MRKDKNYTTPDSTWDTKKKYGPDGYERIKNKALKRGIPFAFHHWTDLYSWFRSQPNECYYCRSTPSNYRRVRKRLSKYTGDNLFLNKIKNVMKNSSDNFLTIDRVDPHYGYTPTNMRLACHICNQIKGAFLNKEQGKVVCPLVVSTIERELREEEYSENGF